MARPQQPELARSAKTDLDPDHVETGLQGQKKPSAGGPTGPVPPENQPGHHPAEDQDKPDPDAFAARLGTDPAAPAATSARKPARPRTTTAKRPAGAPTPKREAAPGPEDAAHFSAPQPEPPRTGEPRLVGLVLLPLRQAVKRLDQLERILSERLGAKRRS